MQIKFKFKSLFPTAPFTLLVPNTASCVNLPYGSECLTHTHTHAPVSYLSFFHIGKSHSALKIPFRHHSLCGCSPEVYPPQCRTAKTYPYNSIQTHTHTHVHTCVCTHTHTRTLGLLKEDRGGVPLSLYSQGHPIAKLVHLTHCSSPFCVQISCMFHPLLLPGHQASSVLTKNPSLSQHLKP